MQRRLRNHNALRRAAILTVRPHARRLASYAALLLTIGAALASAPVLLCLGGACWGFAEVRRRRAEDDVLDLALRLPPSAAIDALLVQIARFRALAPLPVDRSAVAKHLRSEAEEFLATKPGSLEEFVEAGDVVSLAMHVAITTGYRLEDILDSAAYKLRARLDLFEAHGSWDAAKKDTSPCA